MTLITRIIDKRRIKLNHEKRQEIELILNKYSIEDIENSIGRIVQSQGVLEPQKAPNIDEIKKKARMYLDERLPVFQDIICNEYDLPSKLNREKDSVTIVATIADLIASSVGTIPVNMVATLIVKKGIEDFCEIERR